MSIHIVGLDALLSDLGVMSEDVDNCIDQIAKDATTMILEEAIDNVNGQMNSNWKKSKGSKTVSKRSLFQRISKGLRGGSIGITPKGDLPYPVSVNTGTLKRSLKMQRVFKGKFKIFADATIANYAIYVHEGTSRMKARPFLDDAVDTVLADGRYLDNAANIVERVINR